MMKVILMTLAIALLPSVSSAAEENPMETQTILEKISELQVFKLRLPYSLQRALKRNAAQAAAASPDSCQTRNRMHQKGAEVDYSCDMHKALKQELSAVAAN